MNAPQNPQPTLGLAAAGTAAYNPAWYAASTIFIDPSGANGGNDANSGTVIGSPIRTWSEATRRWGSSSPTLSVSTTITFLSSHTDNTDPVAFSPMGIGATLIVVTAPTPAALATGALSGVTAKNRTAGANSSLIATLPAGAAVGQMVVNTTAGPRLNSRCFIKKSLGGSSFELSQPFAAQALPLAAAPAEVDGWIGGDTVSLIQPIAVNIIAIGSVPSFITGGNSVNLNVYNLAVFDPQGAGNSILSIEGSTNFVESQIQRFAQNTASSGIGATTIPQFSNTCWLGGFVIQGAIQIFGGCTTAFCGLINSVAILDGDFANEGFLLIDASFVEIGFMWMGAAVVFNGSSTMQNVTFAYGGHVLYGRAATTLSLNGTTRAVMNSGTWVAGWTAPTLVTGVTMNGGTVAQTHTNASPDVVTSGVTTSVANADAATGGTMMVWGGASLSKAA